MAPAWASVAPNGEKPSRDTIRARRSVTTSETPVCDMSCCHTTAAATLFPIAPYPFDGDTGSLRFKGSLDPVVTSPRPGNRQEQRALFKRLDVVRHAMVEGQQSALLEG